jgi:hypothetical protein
MTVYGLRPQFWGVEAMAREKKIALIDEMNPGRGRLEQRLV